MSIIDDLGEALSDAQDVERQCREQDLGQPGWGDPEDENQRAAAGQAIRLIRSTDSQTVPLLTEAKKRSSLIQLKMQALAQELVNLDQLVEETEGVLDAIRMFELQMEQDGFSSGESSEDEEEDEEEEEEEDEEEDEEEEGDDQYDREYAAQAAADTAEQKRKLEDGEIELYEENGRVKERRLR